MSTMGYFSWHSVDSKQTYPWMEEIRTHVDPLLRVSQKQDHMALRHLMKKVYEQSLMGLWISSGTYYLFPSKSDRLHELHRVLMDKPGIDMHFVSVHETSMQLDYISDKFDGHLDSLLDNFNELLAHFLFTHKAYDLRKIHALIDHVSEIEKELEAINIKRDYAGLLQSRLDAELEKL